MGWFWKERKGSSPELEAIQQLKEQNNLLEEQCRLMGEQITKLSRLQYKTGNDIQGKLDTVSDSIGSVIKKQEAYDDIHSRLIRAEAKLEDGVQSLIHWLDDLDLVNSRLTGEDQASWKKLVEQWSGQILNMLERLEITELKVLGSSFDPRLAESIGTISRAEKVASIEKTVAEQEDIPYQIVEVLKRGFISENGTLLRKAQVITLEEEHSDAE